jgi:hypothetical protein
MNPDERQLRAYLLHRMSVAETEAFEALVLDNPELLRTVRSTEQLFLTAPLVAKSRAFAIGVICFLAGAIASAAAFEIAYLL